LAGELTFVMGNVSAWLRRIVGVKKSPILARESGFAVAQNPLDNPLDQLGSELAAYRKVQPTRTKN